MQQYSEYEFPGSYITAYDNMPTYVGFMSGGKWIVDTKKPSGKLAQDKTYPSVLGGVTEIKGSQYAYTKPIKGMSGYTSATFFPIDAGLGYYLTKSKDAKGTSYGKESGKYETSWIKKVAVGLIATIAATYLVGVLIKAKVKA